MSLNPASSKTLAKLFNISQLSVEDSLEKEGPEPINIGSYGLGRGKARLWDLDAACETIKRRIKEGKIRRRRKPKIE